MPLEPQPTDLTKKELSLLYAPTLSVEGARQRLRRWLTYNPRLVRALERAGLRPRQKTLTPRQVKIIYQYLGEP